MLNFANKLRFVLDKSDIALLPYLILFSVFMSAIETLGFAAVMPFVSIILDPEDDWLSLINSFIGAFAEPPSKERLIIILSILLMSFYLFRATCLFYFFKTLAWYSESRFERLTTKLFRIYLKMSLQDFSRGNSGQKLKDLSSETARLTTLVSSLLLMLSEICVFVFLYGFLIWLNFKITLILSGIFFVVATLIYVFVVKKIRSAGVERANKQEFFFKNVSSDFGNYKYIKINSKQFFSLSRFSSIAKDWACANMVSATLGHVPRITFETLCFAIVIFMVVLAGASQQDSIAQLLPLISVYVLALYRVLPSFNRIFAALNEISFQLKALDIIFETLSLAKDEKLKDDDGIKFKEVKFQNLTVGYDGRPVIENINFSIKKGDWVCISGETGSGKSTLLDVIMGLLKPIDGKVIVDGMSMDISNSRGWRSQFGLVPQNVYLFDGSISENIAYGEHPDPAKINYLLDVVGLSEIVKERGGLNSRIGEGGINFSGGQKQRFAIARALYKSPTILAFDEATNALDKGTEKIIVDRIKKLFKDTTVIFITHNEDLKSMATKIIHLN